jgi:hypothetical protein
MRFFASWWERFPVREVAPSLAVALVVAIGLFPDIAQFFQELARAAGSLWD